MKHSQGFPNLVSIILGIGILGALTAILVETNWGRSLRKEAVLPKFAAAKPSEISLLPVFSMQPLETAFQESANRPLFMPSRRSVPAAVTAPRLKPGQFLLVGTSKTKEFGDSAMLKEIASNKTTVVKLGSTVLDMTVDSIEHDRVVLRVGDDREEVKMVARSVPGASARPGGATQPGQTAPGAAGPGMPRTAAPVNNGIFGGPPAAQNVPPVLPPGAQFAPGAPGTPTVFPGAPGSNIVIPGQANPTTPTTQPRAPTPEEILERRRRARAQQAQ